jgi:SPP1 gp7 family putative phage head morphogenesis protein
MAGEGWLLMQPPFVALSAGRTTRESKAGDTHEDPLADTKRQFETRIEAGLLATWREFSRRFVEYLQQHPETQAKGLVDDVLGLGLWDDLAQMLNQVLLPGIEEMMHTAVDDAVETLPFDIGVGRDAVHTDVADWAREYAGDLIKDIDDTTKERVRSAVANWIEAGESLPALEKRIQDIFDVAWRAKMIAVTEVTRAFAEAKERAWMASDVITRKRWQTAADDLVCPICGPLQSLTRKLGKSFPGGIENPPAHPRCRCWLTPVVD